MQISVHFQDIVRTIAEVFQDQWFDRTRNVRTSGNVSLHTAGIATDEFKDSELYVPARPAHIRQALREMPLRDVSGYSYVDLGSGKGRTLFVAAEMPFREIIGVEFSQQLHEQACANILSFRRWRRRCPRIRSLPMNAKDFTFPDAPLVLYLFNPFGAETMQHVLDKLESSLRQHPRHVLVVLLWPRCGDQVARIEDMRLHRTTRHHQIFEAHAGHA